MQKRSFLINLSDKTSKRGDMHGLNLGFKTGTLGENPIDKVLEGFNPSIVGLHDVEYPYGQNQYFDIHAIFPDFSRDSGDPDAYNFAPTDEYMKRIMENGREIIFPLGESADYFPKKPFAKEPQDKHKWADICLHIVMHYNAGFADGYKWNIKYFEIYPGADTSACYGGTKESFYELYAITARLIREHFPRVKLGGYSSLGFSSMNKLTIDPELRGAIGFLGGFFAYITGAEDKIPLDFFTFKSTPNKPEELVLHAKYAKSLIKEYSLRSVKTFISEFDIVKKDTLPTTAEYLASMISAEKNGIDAMIFAPTNPSNRISKAMADKAFSSLYSLGGIKVLEEYQKELYTAAGVGGGRVRIAVASLDFAGGVELTLLGKLPENFTLTEIREDGEESCVSGLPIINGKIVIMAKKSSIYLVEADIV